MKKIVADNNFLCYNMVTPHGGGGGGGGIQYITCVLYNCVCGV